VGGIGKKRRKKEECIKDGHAFSRSKHLRGRALWNAVRATHEITISPLKLHGMSLELVFADPGLSARKSFVLLSCCYVVVENIGTRLENKEYAFVRKLIFSYNYEYSRVHL